ncbi:E3 ubiquitin-protein ligase rnf213-alpha-like isoform X2 [Anguilla rostrata]|uniref:E3 ubiquitin-protein ligase rnf213-alpha-like isoform X2 n=1 Tax=Anguilla rostrata TaxID=7938 RepID=UPI0030D45E16
MKCPECQHASAEKNAKFCSQCGFRFVQLSGQPQQKPSVPVEEQRMASMVTETTNASAKQPNEETKGNPKKKKKKKKKKKSTKENKGPAPSKSDQMTSDLSDMSLIDMKGIKEQGREASDSESSISDMDETLDSLQDQGNTLEEPCTGCPLDETAARQAHCPAPIGPATQSEGDPATPPGNLTLGEVRQQTVSEDKEGKKEALNVQRACADQNTDVDQNTSVDQNANMTNQIKQKTQQAQQSRDTKPDPAGDQTMVFGPQIKTQEKKKKKENENKGPKSLEVDQMTSDLSDMSLIDRKGKKEQGGEASDGESSISDMYEAPDSLQDQGKTPGEPCTGCPLDETGACQAHPPAPIGPATQEASPEESQPAFQQPTKPEQPPCNEALTASPAPPSQSERDPANPPGTQSPGGVRQRTDSKNNKGKNDAVNTRRACADQNTSVDQNANVTSQIKQKTQQDQQNRDTKPGPASDQTMVFGSQKKPQSKGQASSRTSSGTDPKVEQEQLQKKSSSSKEDPSQGKETDTDMKDAPPPKRIPPANQQIPASDRLTIYFHAVLSKDFKFKPDNDRIFLRAGNRIGNWEKNAVELTVSRDLGDHGFFVEGKLMTTKNEATSVSIPYKYVVYKQKKEKYEYEYIYKVDAKNTTNRCLFVKPHLLNEEGEWHQYDDIICVEPSKNLISRGLEFFWPDQKKKIIHGREIAGRIMLETIFDLLSTWSEINLKSFLTQLKQFHQIYANPFVYEETHKKWYSLDYGEKEVNLLLKQVVLESVTPQLGKDSSGRNIFIKDPLYAAVIVLYIWSTYNIRLDNGELSRLCVELCLPELPKDDFISYWADFVVSFSHIKKLPEMVLALVGQVNTEGMPHWILAVPLLHFLRGSSVPFEPVLRTISTKYELSWAGLEGLKFGSTAYKSSQDRRAIINMIRTHKHLLEADALLARSWMLLMTLEELVDCCCIAQIGLLDILQAFYLKAPAEVSYSSCTHVSDVLAHIQKSLVEQQYSLQSEDYGRACLTTAIELLDKICRGVKSSGYTQNFTEIPVACVNMVALVLEFFLSCQPQESTDVGGAKMKAKDRELLGGAMNIMRRWVSQTFRNRLTTGYVQISLTSEIEMWNNVISLSFKNEDFTKEWRQLFTTDFEGKFEKESPLDQIEIYCSSIEQIGDSYPHVANSIEKCALQAVNSICQAKAEAKLFEKIKINWKFGKLISAIIEKSWPRDARGHYLEGEEVILQHMLNWTAARDIFKLHGVDEKLTDKLSDEASERMAVASSAFTSISHKVFTGAIEIKLLNQILKNQTTFIELLKIDCLSDNEKCKDSSAMRRLLQWRREEVEAVYHERKLVESLITMSHKLQEHIAVSMGNLEEKLKINIEVMTLDQFMDVQKFDTLLSDMTSVVTFFNLDQNTEEMAKVLCVLKDSFIFCMCWENQAKELSRRNPHNDGEDDDEDDYNEDFIDAEEERELQLVATLPVIYSDIYQPSYHKYQKIYSDLKSGALKLGEVDVIFKAYKGKYEELRNELEIMCRTDRSEERNWIQRRVGQIEQYHEVHLAVESALVIKKVKDTLCLQGDFKVLDMLLEVADVNFKKESLDRIDNNLIQAKRDMVEITEQRLLCLQELGERKNFVMWVKEALEDINELKVFVDLASISAGENDLDVDRVACFHDAVLGYSPMLYELKPNSGFDVFKETLKKLWKALDNDHNLPKKLRDTARHLEWLKTVKESHGSVELSSLSLASAINKKGIYIISAQNQKKLSLDTALKLTIPEEHEDGQEMRCYSLEELRELQNKLMLMSGKGEQGQGEVEHFVEVFAGIQRLTVAFVDLYTAGNPLFRHWEANINCSAVNGDGMAGIIMDFNLNTAVGEIMLEGDMLEHLLELCRKMERCLEFWKAFVDQQRSQHYYLNYFTAEQIVYLCDRLTQKKVGKLDGQALMMLSFIKPKCGVHDLRQTWHELQYELLTMAPEQNKDIDFQTFVEKTNSMEAAPTFEEEAADLPSLVERASGSRKLDVVWNAYMRDMQSFLPGSLDVSTLGRLLEILAKQEEDDDDDEDEVLMLAERKENCVFRTLPNGLVCGQPNLVICPRAEVLKSCISVYMNSGHEPLPTYDEVLLCTAATPYEQVELFLRRCLTAGCRGEKIYTLLYAEDLAYEASYRVEQLFQRLEKQCSRPYRLVIICSADREHAYIPSAFSQYRLHMVPLESLEKIQGYLSRHYTVPSELPSAAAVFRDRKFVRVVTSKRAGVGKSLYIQRLYEELRETTKTPSLLKCIRLIEPSVDENVVLQSLISSLQKKELTIFHFDITSSVRKGLYEFLFKLLVLRYLMDSEGRMWKCSNTHLYVIEILQFMGDVSRTGKGTLSHAQFAFLDVFPKVFCRPPKEVLELEMQMRDDPSMKDEDPLMDDQEFRSEAFQRPYQYLTRFHNGISLDEFRYNGVEGTHVQCLQMLFVYCGIVDPSWAELRNFAWFLNLQLRDCETSVFCQMDFVGDTLGGFKNFVVDFMILMAKDFATPSLSISDQSPGRQLVDLAGATEADLAPFRIRKRWESEPHPYIFFNDDHISMTFIGFHLKVNGQNSVDAIDPVRKTVIKPNVMSRELYEGLKLQRVPFNIDFDQLQRGEKIERLCNVLGIQWPMDPDETYELTTDNILKMLAIHMRFRCGIPVIIMGETGCGKTRLVKYLCELRRSGVPTENMKLVKVHGGTTSDMIYAKVREADNIALFNKQKYNFNSILFFDEANTTEAVSSIKEVLCDGTVKGQPLTQNTGLQIIAACNPYRKHSDEMIQRLESAGLGYRVRAEETDDKLGSIPLRQLVYRVQALPPSMIPLVWDFGQLNDCTEKMYIQQIVQRVVDTNSISTQYIEMITNVLSTSQKYMRTRKDECSFVSLRDVERCMQAFVWFYKNHKMLLTELRMFLDEIENPERSGRLQRLTESRNPVEWSLVMAVGVCYHACLEDKDSYRKKICKLLPETNTPQKVAQEISLMQDLLLSGFPLGETIARNNALKENVFMMVICIELRIPLFLVGKPGSSKSLSKTLVADAMQGQAAHSELYKKLKQIHLVSFQCSPHSTPEGIINTFKQCARFQEGKNLREYISVVVLDEIGLAEDSPKMPLKTLHPLLEEGCIDDEPLPHKKVGFIGISNWALDPAKMNRGIFVSRGDPDLKELIESAKGICSSDKMVLEKVRSYFQPFARAYLNVCRKQGKGFFGLRDYYSLIKMVFAIAKVSTHEPSPERLVEAVLRNFSGKDNVDAVRVFITRLDISPNMESISAIELVRQNISAIGQDDECRYLLVLTKNYAALQILQQTFFSDQHQPEIIFGSSFPKDQEYTQICRNINRVKICMETGQTIVLLNLQNLYESLYDALNQYYVCLGGQKYVDLGLGTHRVKCRVHKDFRLIVIEEKEVVYKQFPIPLINRLEKHYLDINTVLKSDQKGLVLELEKWVGLFVTLRGQHSMVARLPKYLPVDVFIGYHSDTCASVVLQVTEKLKEESEMSDYHRHILDEAKLILLGCATPDSVVRLDSTALPSGETEQLAHVYFEQQKHSSLADFIISHTQQEEWCHASFTEVTTFSRLMTASDIGLLQDAASNIELLSLQQFDTEHSFLKKIRHFLDSTSGFRILIIQTDFNEGSQSANLIASAKYSAMNEISKSRDEEMRGKVFVYFITKLPRMEGGTSYVGFHGGPWKSVHIDDLRRSKDIISDIKALRGLTISQLFEDKVEEHDAMEVEDMYTATGEQEMECSEPTDGWEAVLDTTALVRSCVQSAVRMLKDQGEGGARSTRRVEILLTLLADSEELKAAFLTALKRRLHTLLVSYDGKSFSSKNWVINEASNVDALQEGGTFRHALWKRVQAVVTPLLAQLVAVADRDCNLDLLLDHNSGEPVRKLWLDIFRDEKLLEVPFAAVDRNSESKTILVQSYITPQLGAGCSLPFSWRVRDYLEELRVHAQHHEGHTVRQFEDFFRNTPLGRYIAEAAEETQREFFQRYLQDFVCMTMKVTSEEELQLLCTALTCCVNELRIREDVEEDEVISLPWVHAAHQEFKNRLQNLSRMVAMEPKVALHLQRIEGSREGPEMVLDVFAALACVELLEPRGLDSDRERLAWLRQVKRLQGPVELACSEEICSRYGERSREQARTVRRGWSRIFSLSLFVEHMLVGIEGVEEKLRPLLLERTRVLGQVLGTNSDLKMEPPFLAVIGILKACMDGANDRIFKFGRQPCPVCMGDPHEPLSLPCHHIYCLACIRQWLIPGQMYCPLCKQEVPDDFNLATSEDIRLRIVMYSQFRKRCNAFFIDMVSTVCFKDNAPPSSEVIQHLLSYLMVAVEAVRTIRARTPVFTKALSPFDDSVDKNPVVRSVILKLLLKYSFAEVKDYLQQHLSDVERSNILDEGDKSELYSLYINCLQDSMLEWTQCRTAAERTACLQDERNFLKHFLRRRGVRARATTIEHLQEVARVRLCLDMAAHLMADQQTNPGPCEGARDAVSGFLGCVADLCVRSGNGWYRVYLIRKVCSQQGMEFVQKLQATAELRWLFPEELLQNQEGGQMDHFLVWGEDYRTIREAVAKATMKGGTEGIEEACERCGGTPAKKTVLLLLALFREVTTLYRTANHSLHPKQELLHALKGFIHGSRVLVRPEAQAFALALVHNQLGALTVGADRPGVVHGLVELTVHLAAVLMTVNHGCLAPLRLLALSPARMQAAFLPTMPEDMLAVARAALGPLMWYYCPNGHPCTVGECGRPMEVRRCLDCNLPVGGSNHQPLQGFNPVNVQGDRTQSGHILGDPGRRDMPDMLDTKSMSPAPFTLVRLLTHLSMLIGASEHPQVIAQIIKPPVADPGSFLIGHLLKDMEQLGRVLGKGSDDTVSMAHLTVLSLLDANPPTQWPVSHDDVLSTKEARNAWETGVASDIIVPQLKTLERQLKEANDLIRTDSRVSSSPVMRLVFGDPRLTLATLPRDSPIHSGAVWSCRERVSLRALAHVVEQNDGRDALPVLWRFLHKEPELSLVRFLPEILALQRELVKKFQNAPDVTCSTIHEFIQGLTAASLKTWYETRIKIFLKTWNQLRQSLATKGELKIPAELCQTDLGHSSDLQVLLPRRQGQGLCATALVSYLIALHNEQVHAVDKHTGEETSYTVSPADLSDLHVIRYEPERDLLPLVLSHCQYSVERGQETISEYDLPKIQQQVVTRFLQGKPLISLVGIPTLVNRHDRNYVNIFKDVKDKVGQEALPALTLAALAGELAAYSDVCEALEVVEVALGFLAMTGENPDMQLVCYLRDILQMGDRTAPHILKALSRCSLKHCAAVWQLLASLKSENMLRLKRDPFVGVMAEYKKPLSEEERGLLMAFLSKGSVDTCLLEMHEFLLLHLKDAQALEMYRASWGLKETLVSYIERKDVDVPPDVELLPDEICLSKFVEAWKLIAAFRQNRGRR